MGSQVSFVASFELPCRLTFCLGRCRHWPELSLERLNLLWHSGSLTLYGVYPCAGLVPVI